MRLGLCLAWLGLTGGALAQSVGPSILSRGEAPAAMNTQSIEFRPFAEVESTYSTGLAGIRLNDDGKLVNSSGVGVRATWGVSGAHSWRHTRLGLDYRGSATHYPHDAYYDGANQSILFGVSHRFSPHTQLTLRESAGTFSRTFGLAGLSQTVPFDPVSSYIPTTDFFDNRTFYLTTQADFTYQRTARLSFNLGGDAFVNRRRSSALVNVTGQAARGDVQYRISKTASVGGSYQFAHFDFSRGFGGTDLHVFNGVYSIRLSRTVEFSSYGGVMRIESKFFQATPLDPRIAAWLGILTRPQIVHRISLRPDGGLRISRTYAKGILYASGGYGATPGNGLFLTSYSTRTQVGYTYTGIRFWSFGTSVGADRSQATGTIAGNYQTVTATVSAARQLGSAFHLVGQGNLRRYSSNDYGAYNRSVFEVRIGIGYSPGNVPFRLW